MKFKGRNGGMAIAIRNHIMLFRVFVISLLISIIPIMFFICAHNPYFWIFLIIPLMSYITSRQRRVYHPQLVVVYHQCGALYIIKPQVDTRWRVMRYSPAGADDMHRTSCGDDMPSLRLG